MRILVVGGGGREHAIIKKLRQSPLTQALFCAPGNGGIAQDATCIPVKVMNFPAIYAAVKENNVDFVVVAPDDPLCAGLVDYLQQRGVTAFGPNKDAAIIEGSKVFSKALMQKYGIPTAAYETFTELEPALNYVKTQNRFPTVIKADGLALGKGVIIAQDYAQAEDALNSMFIAHKFGASGDKVVIEEFLTGVEASVLAFCDGKTVKPMVSAKDHKKIFDGDKGPNTGGMGAIAPHPLYTEQLAERCMKEIFLPTMDAMNREGRTFKGVIYFGLMLTADGPKVIEYNARFGDPETQVVLPLLNGDLAQIMLAVTKGELDKVSFSAYDKTAACVVMASGGYPGGYAKGYEVGIPADCRATVYHAGTALKDGRLVTSGGRVLGVTCVADELQTALKSAYEAVDTIKFTDSYCRKDIGVIY